MEVGVAKGDYEGEFHTSLGIFPVPMFVLDGCGNGLKG